MAMVEDIHSSCFVSIELSRSKWVLGVLLPSAERVRLRQIDGGDTEALLRHFDDLRSQSAKAAGQDVTIFACFEAGYDGFWLARLLNARGVITLVLDPTSFLVMRRGRRAKTDRIDAEVMAYTLRAYVGGDRAVCREVRIPSPEEEDAKRLHRERIQLKTERTRHVNRIRGLLNLHGIRDVKGLWGGAWRQWLSDLQTGDGRQLGAHVRQELTREFERLDLVIRHIHSLDGELEAGLVDDTAPLPQAEKVRQLATLKGIGSLGATVLVSEVFHREFASRRHLASYLGLAPSPYASGDMNRDQGISKAGNGYARTRSSNWRGAGSGINRTAS